MWRAVNTDGTLTYTFVEGVKASYPYYGLRLLGGLLYLSGMVMMAYNTWRTIAGGTPAEAPLVARGEPVLDIRVTPVAPVTARQGNVA
jgi:cytochrome c oxidase cbb3-type subunit 1